MISWTAPISLVLITFAFAGCLWNTITKFRNTKRFPRTEGRVVEVKLEEKILKNGQKQLVNHVVVEYVANGHTYTIKEKTEKKNVKTGDTRIVIYNPQRPSRAMYKGAAVASILPTVASAAAMIAVIVYLIK